MSSSKVGRMVQNRSGQLAIQQDGGYEPRVCDTDMGNQIPAASLSKISSSSSLKKSKSRTRFMKRTSSGTSSTNLFEGDFGGGVNFGPLRSNHNSFARQTSFVHNGSPTAMANFLSTTNGAAQISANPMLLGADGNSFGQGNSSRVAIRVWEAEDVSEPGLLLKIDGNNAGKVGSEGQATAGGLEVPEQKTKRRLSDIILSSWFFQRRKSEIDDEEKESKESTPCPDGKQKLSLSNFVNKKFSAASDFRHLNLWAPQSM